MNKHFNTHMAQPLIVRLSLFYITYKHGERTLIHSFYLCVTYNKV